MIDDCFKTARRCGTAIPVVKVVETLRHIHPEGTVPATTTVPRDKYRLVQTPQMFDIQLHKKAYSQPYRESFTDDASVIEALGHEVTLVEGNRENIKITTPFDLIVAEALANAQRSTLHSQQP